MTTFNCAGPNQKLFTTSSSCVNSAIFRLTEIIDFSLTLLPKVGQISALLLVVHYLTPHPVAPHI